MFSQFVQNLAAPHSRQSSESAPDPRPASPSRTRSLDGTTAPPSTGQLAESALSNLRKSLASQRPASPGQKSPPPPRAHKSTLEDRLRANFTIGEASNESTPAVSSRVSPAPPPVDKPAEELAPVPEPELSIQPMSPASTPLPESRISSPIELHEPTPILVAPPPPSSEPVAPASPKPTSPRVDRVSALEAEVALPPTTPDAQPDEGLRITDVEALQERLKLVEQRFSGN